MSDQLSAGIRRVLSEHARLPSSVDSIGDEQDLFAAGMSSHASVNVMLALEDRFDIEFPDRMLTRERVREHLRHLRGDLRASASVRMTVVVDSAAEFVATVTAIADDVAATHADEVDRDARFPHETIDALREAGALGAHVPERFGGGGMSLDAIALGCFALGRRCSSSAMVFAMHQIQVGTIVRHLDGAPWFRVLSARAQRPAAPDRLGHVRGRYRWRHGPIDRRGDAGRRRGPGVREAGADGQLRSP